MEHLPSNKQFLPMAVDDFQDAFKDLASAEFMLLVYYTMQKHSCTLGRNQLMKDLHMAASTLSKAKNGLIHKQYLHIEHNSKSDNYYVGKNSVNRYLKATGQLKPI